MSVPRSLVGKAIKIGGYYLVTLGALLLVPVLKLEITSTALVLILLVLAPFLFRRLASFEYGGVKLELRDLEDRVSNQIATSGAQVREDIEAVRESLEDRLAEFSRVSADYLRPQPLEISDAKIQQMREDPPTLSKNDLRTALASLNPNLRIPAYVQLASFPDHGFIEAVANCFLLEQFEAATHKETRPLWQLLLVAHAFMGGGVFDSATSLLRERMLECLAFLKSTDDVDVEGQCEARLTRLLAKAGG